MLTTTTLVAEMYLIKYENSINLLHDNIKTIREVKFCYPVCHKKRDEKILLLGIVNIFKNKRIHIFLCMLR